jgi:hypothetical protein
MERTVFGDGLRFPHRFRLAFTAIFVDVAGLRKVCIPSARRVRSIFAIRTELVSEWFGGGWHNGLNGWLINWSRALCLRRTGKGLSTQPLFPPAVLVCRFGFQFITGGTKLSVGNRVRRSGFPMPGLNLTRPRPIPIQPAIQRPSELARSWQKPALPCAAHQSVSISPSKGPRIPRYRCRPHFASWHTMATALELERSGLR